MANAKIQAAQNGNIALVVLVATIIPVAQIVMGLKIHNIMTMVTKYFA